MGIATRIAKAYQTEVTGDVRVLRNTKRTLTRTNTPNGAPIANFESSKPQRSGGISWQGGRGILNVSTPKLHGGFTRKMTPSTQGRIARITGMGKSVFGMAKFDPLVKRFVPREERRKDAKRGHALPDGSFPIDNESDLHNAERLVGRSKHPAAARALIERRKRELNKAVVAGTRPFAQRALPKEQVKQVRAKAPRYGVMKSGYQQKCAGCKGASCKLCGGKGFITGNSSANGRGPRSGQGSSHFWSAIKNATPVGVSKSLADPCDNCGQRPAQDGVPLCVGCASWMEKARKKKPEMVDHVMRMESGDASEDEGRHAMQQMVNSGDAWRMQGSYGRAAMDMIRSGHIALGHTGHRDYYGNYVPSRHEVQEGTKGHASFVRAAGNEPDRCGKDCPTPEVPNQLPQSIRNKKINKAFFDRFPLGPLTKTYVRVDATRAEGFLKADARGYPESQCPECGKHGNALEVMLHMQQTGHVDDDKGMNAHTKIGRAVPELDGHTGMGTLKSMRKGFEFKVLDENDPEYHGHTGGGAGYAGKKWVHMHGPTTSTADETCANCGHDHTQRAVEGDEVRPFRPGHSDVCDCTDQSRGPKTDHAHFKMGAWTTNHSPSGYQEEIIGHTGKNEADSLCALPNCGHPESRHSFGDDGRPACMDCNNTRPRRNVRHSFRSTPDPRSA